MAKQSVSLVLRDGSVFVDNEQEVYYQISEAKAGSLLDIRYENYQLKSSHAIGVVLNLSKQKRLFDSWKRKQLFTTSYGLRLG